MEGDFSQDKKQEDTVEITANDLDEDTNTNNVIEIQENEITQSEK